MKPRRLRPSGCPWRVLVSWRIVCRREAGWGGEQGRRWQEQAVNTRRHYSNAAAHEVRSGAPSITAPGAGTCSHQADGKEEKMRLAGLHWEQGGVGEEGLKRELWKENFLTNYFVFSGFISDMRKEMLCVFLRKCKFLHFIHFKSSPLGLLYWSIKFGGLKWS